MINFVIGKQKACISMGPVSAIKVCNKASVDSGHLQSPLGPQQAHHCGHGAEGGEEEAEDPHFN